MSTGLAPCSCPLASRCSRERWDFAGPHQYQVSGRIWLNTSCLPMLLTCFNCPRSLVRLLWALMQYRQAQSGQLHNGDTAAAFLSSQLWGAVHNRSQASYTSSPLIVPLSLLQVYPSALGALSLLT